jgi:hypothetical protein
VPGLGQLNRHTLCGGAGISRRVMRVCVMRSERQVVVEQERRVARIALIALQDLCRQ